MAIYGESLYGGAFYGQPFGRGGAQTLRTSVWRATILNALVEDLTDDVVGGSVDFALDRDVKMGCNVTMRHPERVNPYVDYLAPFVTVEASDGSISGPWQLGLYALRVPPTTMGINESIATFVGEDLTSILLATCYTSAINTAAGANVVATMAGAISGGGLTRQRIPASTKTFAKKRSWPAGASRMQKVNDIADLIAWFRPYAAHDGVITTPGKYKAPHLREPVVTWTVDDLVEEPQLQPRDLPPRNVVVVIKDNVSEAPLVGTARNDDAASPSSTVTTGVTRVRVERVSDLDTQTEVDALAAQLLTEERMRYTTAKFAVDRTLPLFEAYDVIGASLTGNLAPLSGIWAPTNWSYGLSAENARLEVTAARSMDEAGHVL